MFAQYDASCASRSFLTQPPVWSENMQMVLVRVTLLTLIYAGIGAAKLALLHNFHFNTKQKYKTFLFEIFKIYVWLYAQSR